MMNRWGKESQAGPSQVTAQTLNATQLWFEGSGDEDTLLVQKGPRLNLNFTPTPEHLNKVTWQKAPYSTENTETLMPPERFNKVTWQKAPYSTENTETLMPPERFNKVTWQKAPYSTENTETLMPPEPFNKVTWQKAPYSTENLTPPEHFNKVTWQKPHYSTENTMTLITPPETPKNTEKPKAMNFQISKVTIGEWTHKSVYPDDLKAKFYFAKKKLMWEILDQDSTLKRKIEINWSDVLSFKATFDPQDETGTLEVELGKCPTFYIETNPQPGKHTQWKQLDHDFTLNHSASKYRRHTLQCPSRDLKNNLEKLLSADSFWTKLAKVNFPTLPQSLCFDDGKSNNNANRNLSPYGQCRTLGFNGNSDLCHQSPDQGHVHVLVENVNFNVGTQFWSDNQMNPFFEDNHENETMSHLLGIQVTDPSFQLINMGRSVSGSYFNNPMIQDQGQTSNTGELLGTQASAQETQPNSIFPYPNHPTVPTRGPYLRGILAQEDVIQNMKCIRQFQTNGECYCNQCFNKINGSMPPPDS